MTLKVIDPDDTYTIEEFFACGDGHFLTPGFTHWESGECCPHGGHVSDPHLYYRKLMVPTTNSSGQPMMEYLRERPGMWGHLPLAPQETPVHA